MSALLHVSSKATSKRNCGAEAKPRPAPRTQGRSFAGTAAPPRAHTRDPPPDSAPIGQKTTGSRESGGGWAPRAFRRSGSDPHASWARGWSRRCCRRHHNGLCSQDSSPPPPSLVKHAVATSNRGAAAACACPAASRMRVDGADVVLLPRGLATVERSLPHADVDALALGHHLRTSPAHPPITPPPRASIETWPTWHTIDAIFSVAWGSAWYDSVRAGMRFSATCLGAALRAAARSRCLTSSCPRCRCSRCRQARVLSRCASGGTAAGKWRARCTALGSRYVAPARAVRAHAAASPAAAALAPFPFPFPDPGLAPGLAPDLAPARARALGRHHPPVQARLPSASTPPPRPSDPMHGGHVAVGGAKAWRREHNKLAAAPARP